MRKTLIVAIVFVFGLAGWWWVARLTAPPFPGRPFRARSHGLSSSRGNIMTRRNSSMTGRNSSEEGRFSNHPRATPRNLLRRLDRVFGEINPILLALAIGLAVLDATCFSVIRLGDAFSRRTSPGMENPWQLSGSREVAIGSSNPGSAVPAKSMAHTLRP